MLLAIFGSFEGGIHTFSYSVEDIFLWLTLLYYYIFLADTNECEGTEQLCAVNATCINVRGSYNCECKPGFQGNGSINCSGEFYER